VKGSVKKRGKTWRIIVDIGRDENGKRQQKWYSGFATRRAAEAKLTEIKASLQSGEYVEPSKRTLGAFLVKEWLPSIAASVRPSTSTAYKMICDKRIVPTLGSVPLQQLSADQLNKLYAQLLANGRTKSKGALSPRSVRYVHATIHKALSDAVKWQKIPRNVADSATPPRRQSKKPKTWTASELRTFLEHVEGGRLYAAYLLAASTGLRRGELLGLRWRDVDMEAGSLAVVQTLLQVNNKLDFGTPKTEKGSRNVWLDTHTVAALRSHRRTQVAERLAWGPEYQDNDLVFAREDGTPIHPDGFGRTFARHAKAAALPTIRLHDLRHTHATLALQAGIPAKVVSERLGHASISITLDIYSHVLPGMQEEAAQTVADLVFANG